MYIRKDDSNLEIKEKIISKINSKSNTNKDYMLRGWQRCIECGISPFQKKCGKKHEGEELEKILEVNRELITYAKPYMETLYSFVRGSGFAVVLTDENACLLEVIEDEKISEEVYGSTNFVKGAVWSEEHVGNTAINTCIHEGKPIQLSGDEHFCIMHKEWTCSSAPIMRKGNIIGAINVRGYKEYTHVHTLGMVVGAAKAIETIMEVADANKKLIIKNKYQNAIVECISDGFLAIDREGILKYINDIGAHMLGIDKKSGIGKPLKDLIDFDPVILDVVKTGKRYVDKEFILTNRHGAKYHFIKSAMPIRDEEGNIIGAVDSFRKMKRVHNMVRKMVGAYGKFTFEDIIGDSKKIKESIRLAKIAAHSSSNVLINGESGTGKELFVQSIHNASSRKNESFISINCAAIPSELIESELFGYEAGAFTGALKSGQPGKFELANGGTIFLDEIGDMPLHMQAKLLRVLQENQITRVGGSDVIQVDVRIISATNKDLLEECNKGNFRRDLYYRLNVLNIVLPTLRERKEDIEELVYCFINKINTKINKNVKGISKGALEVLKSYSWPGNVRELENTIERAMNICNDDIIDLKDLSVDITLKNNIGSDRRKITEAIYSEKCENSDDIIESLEIIEERAIKKALDLTEGNITKAANALNVSRNTLYNKIRKYGLDIVC